MNLGNRVREKATDLFKTFGEAGKMHGIQLEAAAAACVYHACRWVDLNLILFTKQCNENCSHRDVRINVSYNEFAAKCTAGKSEITRCIQLVSELRQSAVELTITEDFVPKFSQELGLPNEVLLAAGGRVRLEAIAGV